MGRGNPKRNRDEGGKRERGGKRQWTCAGGKIERFTCTDSIIKIGTLARHCTPHGGRSPPFPRIHLRATLPPLQITVILTVHIRRLPRIFALFNEKTFQITFTDPHPRTSTTVAFSALGHPLIRHPTRKKSAVCKRLERA